MYWQAILQGGLWLRWRCARDLHRRRHHRLSRRLSGAHLGPAIAARPHARSDRRQAAGGLLPADAGGRRDHQGLVAVRRHHHPVPRDPGLRPARISGRAAGQRAGHAACEMEDDACSSSRSASCSAGEAGDPSCRTRCWHGAGSRARTCIPFANSFGLVLLWMSALLTLYTGWDYFRAGVRHLIDD